MDASKGNLNLNHQAGDFEPVYIKQEEGNIPSPASAIMKSEDKEMCDESGGPTEEIKNEIKTEEQDMNVDW